MAQFCDMINPLVVHVIVDMLQGQRILMRFTTESVQIDFLDPGC